MGTYKLEVRADLDCMSETAARQWISVLKAAATTPARFAVAICGGRAAGSVFQALARAGAVDTTRFSRTHFFWADERCVPPTDPESNFAEAQRFLLQPLGIQEESIHRIEGELHPGEAVSRANEAVRRFVPAGADGMPVFDFILLSMGEDGHVASLFPGAVETAAESRTPYRFVLGTKPPPERITLNYATIAAAKSVLVMVSEADKAAALRESLKPGGATPLARVIQLRTHTDLVSTFPVPEG